MSTKRQFLRFSLVGTIGFMVDAGVLYLCLPGLGLHGGRVVSFLCAATTTWYLNRKLTFTQCDIAQPARQWARFLATNGIGGLINFATYGLVIFAFGGAGLTPLIGVAAGSIAGLGFNFTVSRRFVFEEQAPLRAQI
jgi:putative flippase GtrA